MSLVNTINYDTAGNFTFDSNKVEFVGALARLKDQAVANETAFNDFVTKDLLRSVGGSPTGTLTGVAALVAGRLQLFGVGDLTFNPTSMLGADARIGAVRFKFIPNYSGAPSVSQTIYKEQKTAGDVKSQIEMKHIAGSSNVNIVWRDDAGVGAGTLVAGAFSPTAGQVYEFELNFDCVAGSQELFIDGVQLGGDHGSVHTRDGANITIIQQGDLSLASDFEIDDLQRFSAVQHTANFASEVPRVVPLTQYATDNPTIVLNSGISADALEGFSESATKPAGSEIKYTMNVDGVDKYWDGAAWVNSNCTYAQSNTAAEVETNKAALDLSTGVTLKTKAFLNSDGTVQPDITSNTLSYSFFVAAPGEISECLIYLNLEDLIQGSLSEISNAKLNVEVSESFLHGVKQILPSIQSATFDAAHASGYYAELSVIETTTPNKKIDFSVSFDRSGRQEIIRFKPAVVPNASSKSLNTLTSVA